jgi:hypothetical protein
MESDGNGAEPCGAGRENDARRSARSHAGSLHLGNPETGTCMLSAGIIACSASTMRQRCQSVTDHQARSRSGIFNLLAALRCARSEPGRVRGAQAAA